MDSYEVSKKRARELQSLSQVTFRKRPLLQRLREFSLRDWLVRKLDPEAYQAKSMNRLYRSTAEHSGTAVINPEGVIISQYRDEVPPNYVN